MFDAGRTTVSAYRPFNKRHVYFDRALNNSVYSLPSIFPDPGSENYGIITTGTGAAMEFTALATDQISDLSQFGGQTNSQFFPRYTYNTSVARDGLFPVANAPSPGRVDNITDATLADYRATYGAGVAKDDVFFYVYGLLHSPEYRNEFAADLKKMLPRIPKVRGAERFLAFAKAGRELSALHIGYESVEPYPLAEAEIGLVAVADEYAKYSVTKMKYAGKAGAWDKTRIIYNSHISLGGIPADAQRYMLGARSALDWIIERYQVKTDKASGIVNDPNDWSREHSQPRYIIDLVGRIVTVSLETNRIVDSLPSLGLDK
jgi:predicted helicase